VLIYRVSGVLNFAHGAVAMFSAFIAYEVSVRHGAPPVIGLLAALIVGALLGLAIQLLTLRPLAGRPAVVKVTVTIGWLLALQTAAGLIWGNNAYHSPVKVVPNGVAPISLFGVHIGFDQLTIMLVAAVLAGSLAALLRFTTLGAQMRAVADNPEAARLWGINVDGVTAASWALGSAMAALAGVLITPLINFTPFSLTILVIDAFAAALIGRLTSLPWACAGAVLLGLAQTYPTACSSNSGMPEVAVFVLVLATLVILFRPGVRALRRV